MIMQGIQKSVLIIKKLLENSSDVLRDDIYLREYEGT
jgi:hypothetical protein